MDTKEFIKVLDFMVQHGLIDHAQYTSMLTSAQPFLR